MPRIIWTPNTQAPLMKVRANGGPVSAVTKLVAAKHTSHRWPSMMPDGKHLIYLAANHQNPTGGSDRRKEQAFHQHLSY